MNKQYEVIGKECRCSGKPVNMILRTATEAELSAYKKQGMNLPKYQAVIACPLCGGTVVNWLFTSQGVETARWALSERYHITPIETEENGVTHNFEVKRIRHSVTQGEAAVYMDGKKLIQYGDTIKLNHPKQYGQIISGWASCLPDELFIDSVKRDFRIAE